MNTILLPKWANEEIVKSLMRTGYYPEVSDAIKEFKDCILTLEYESTGREDDPKFETMLDCMMESNIELDFYSEFIDSYHAYRIEYRMDENEEETTSEPFVPHAGHALSNSGGLEVQLDGSCSCVRYRQSWDGYISEWMEIEYLEREETGEIEPCFRWASFPQWLNDYMKY